jgi:hypothetical protein
LRNREFLMLTTDFNERKHRVAGCFLSEKLDGMRAVWIPQTAGRSVNEVFFANVAKKKGKQAAAICTGLWSRYGNIIYAPPEFINQLPRDILLDGELNFGRGGWQRTMSTVKDHTPGPDWANVKYSIFDSPQPCQMFMDGRINNPNFKKTISWDQAKIELGFMDTKADKIQNIYEFTYKRLQALFANAGFKNVELISQELLPFHGPAALARVHEFAAQVFAGRGEGAVIRFSSSEWEPFRSTYAFKYKEELDSEAQVIGFTFGETGKHHGRLGSLRVLWGNVIFDLGGFTDLERELKPDFTEMALSNPGGLILEQDVSAVFYRNLTIQFKYREITPDGKPKEARFHRMV